MLRPEERIVNVNSSDSPDKQMIDKPSASNDPSLTSGTMLDIVNDPQLPSTLR